MSTKTEGSVESLVPEKQSCDGGSMCLELALEGERLCLAGDCRAGVAFFLAAIQAGTDDLRTLSAIYSQLGNAYFFLGDYHKAMIYHRHDLTLARTLGDSLGEAKASGNLGNTLKVMGRFKEAIACCERHLDIAKEMSDKLSEGRALYNLGNVYHAQGKHLAKVGHIDPGQMNEDVREHLRKAILFYEANLNLMQELGDVPACGRALGNLGNTCYLLGDFTRAIQYHTGRLEIAKEFNDKAAERRANSNLANSFIFLGQFNSAAQHYLRTLELAVELGDSAVEAQACYSLGNTYTLLRDYQTAEVFHARHLEAARRLGDRIGEGRACWSLGNAHAALGNHEKALLYANKHFEISKELGDSLGMATACTNINDLRAVLGMPPNKKTLDGSNGSEADNEASDGTPFNKLRVRRQSMEQLSLLQLTPERKAANKAKQEDANKTNETPEEDFLDLLSKCQSHRMDDQRATLNSNKENLVQNKPCVKSGLQKPGTSKDAMLNAKPTGSESAQREALLPHAKKISAVTALIPKKSMSGKGSSLPGLRTGLHSNRDTPQDDFLDMIARVQGSRLEDQRTVLPPVRPKTPTNNIVADEEAEVANGGVNGRVAPQPSRVTVPDDDIFAIVMRMQNGRMDDQRASIPVRRNQPGNNNNNDPAYTGSYN